MTVEITVGHTWDGQVIPKGHHSRFTLRRMESGIVLEVDAPYWGDAKPAEPPGSTWELWNYEVVEWFVVGEGSPRPYLEVELGPHGHYLVLQLCGVREIVRKELPLTFHAEIHGARWFGRAVIPEQFLPPGPFTHNAFAIHGVGDHRVHYSHTPVPGDGPDFHRIGCYSELGIFR